MLLSIVLSIHNRAKLFRRALQSYLWQTLPRQEWEIVLVDDLSTEDLSMTYRDILGQVNLRHVKFDHRRHEIFKTRNPDWTPGMPEDWYHTPALTTNFGCSIAKGQFICLCHPEIIHAPGNFERAVFLLSQNPKQYLFGRTYLGTCRTNLWLDERSDWFTLPWDSLIYTINRPYPLVNFGPNELYWYTSFLPKAAVEAARGVSFIWLHGVAGEDDAFRDCVKLAGYPPVHVPEIQGLHQDHSDETEPHRQRQSEHWQTGLKRNRDLYYAMKEGQIQYPYPANLDYDWTAKECAVEILEHPLR